MQKPVIRQYPELTRRLSKPPINLLVHLLEPRISIVNRRRPRVLIHRLSYLRLQPPQSKEVHRNELLLTWLCTRPDTLASDVAVVNFRIKLDVDVGVYRRKAGRSAEDMGYAVFERRKHPEESPAEVHGYGIEGGVTEHNRLFLGEAELYAKTDCYAEDMIYLDRLGRANIRERILTAVRVGAMMEYWHRRARHCRVAMSIGSSICSNCSYAAR